MKEAELNLQNVSDIGLYLKKIRKKKKITQVELAEYAGLSRAGVVKVESGESDIKLSTLIAIANLLGVDLVLRGRGSKWVRI